MPKLAACAGPLAIALALLAQSARAEAPSDDAISSYLNSTYKGPISVVDYRRVYDGALGGLKDVAVVAYSLQFPAGEHGETQKTNEVEVYATEDDRLKTIPVMSIPPGQVQNVSVSDGKLFVETRTFSRH